jgi:hypothetical protein
MGDMRVKLLAFAPIAILAGACAPTSAETLDCVGSRLSGVTTSLISAVNSNESSTWEMLLVGFLGLGYAARPRRKKSRLEGLTISPGSFEEPALAQKDEAIGLVGSLDEFDLDTRRVPFPSSTESPAP